MPKLAIVLWIANIVLDTAGHLAFKSAASAADDDLLARWKTMLASPLLWTGIVSFCLEFAVWFALLSVIPLSQAMLIGSINIVVVMLAGRAFFKERLDGMRIAGMTFIAIGVALAGGFA
jgi:drug/metabolite transporter (DMT)-like permease